MQSLFAHTLILPAEYESKTGAIKQRYESICKAMSLSPPEEELLKQNLRIIEVRQMRQEASFFPRFPLTDAEVVAGEAG
jgi:hypothetical protein